MRIKVISLGPTEMKRGPKSSYSVFELTYSDDGKTKNKKLFSFNKGAFQTLSTAEPGQWFDITTEKKGEFWEWTAASRVEGAGDVVEGTVAAPKAQGGGTGGYRGGWQKDPEKDAQIARSVALKAAIDYLAGVAGSKVDKSPEGVLGLSNQFEGYLLGGYVPTGAAKAVKADTIPSLEDDIPF